MFLLLIYSVLVLIRSVELSDFSIHVLSDDHVCTTSCAMSIPVGSAVECRMNCGPESKFCYNPVTNTCTCCLEVNSTATLTTCPSAQDETLCYQRQADCPNDGIRVGTWCFFLHAEWVNFETCKSVCDGVGGRVLKMISSHAQDVVTSFIEAFTGLSERIWLGVVSNATGADRPWYYSDTGVAVTFLPWADLEPNGHTTEFCVAVNAEPAAEWIDIDCLASLSCICGGM